MVQYFLFKRNIYVYQLIALIRVHQSHVIPILLTQYNINNQ